MAKKSQTLGFQEIANLEQRRANRRSIGAVEATSILKGSDEWRFYYTVKEVVERSEVWFVNKPDGTLIDFSIGDRWVTPFWPHEDIARLACKKMDMPCEVNPMPLDHWIDEELNRICRSDNGLIALCPSDGYAKLKTVDEVLSVLAQYAKDPQAYWDQHFADDGFFLTQELGFKPKGHLA